MAKHADITALWEPRSTFATQLAPGNAVPTRTPTVFRGPLHFFASTSLGGSTSVSSTQLTSGKPWTKSTTDLVLCSVGPVQQANLPRYKRQLCLNGIWLVL